MFKFYNLIKTKLLLQLSSKYLGLQHFPKSKEDSLTSIEWLFQSIVTSPEKRHLLFTFSQSSDKCVTIYSFSLDVLIGQANAVRSRHTLAIVSGFSFPEASMNQSINQNWISKRSHSKAIMPRSWLFTRNLRKSPSSPLKIK